MTIGYGVAVGDVDGDGRSDVLLADARRFSWYRNPDWTRFTLAEDLTAHDNVCIAARDLDGDGRVEIAVGGAWNPGDTVASGSVHHLVPGADPTAPWTARALPCEPTVHRMHWVRLEARRFALVVAPLHGRGNQDGRGAPVRVLACEPPPDSQGEWRVTEVDAALHQLHNLDAIQADAETTAEEILCAGREGVRFLAWHGDAFGWTARAVEGVQGAGEVRLGRDRDGSAFLVTVEPMHGHELALYRWPGRGAAQRDVLDADLRGGHALAVADLCGGAGDEVVYGWREPDDEGRFGLRVLHRDADGAWRAVFDDPAMSTEDVRAADLDGDGRIDIVASGRRSHDLKVYWNRAP